MADTAPAKSPAKKRAAKPKKPASHPKYADMIKKAVGALKERNGSSRQAIQKYICATYKVDPNKIKSHLKLALRAGVKSGSLKQSKGTGASGSFRLGEQDKKTKKPKAKTARKPKAAGAKKVRKPKAAGVKKSPKKAKKPKAAKKSPAKKAAKPKAVRKSPAKKAAKPKKPKAAKKKPAAKK